MSQSDRASSSRSGQSSAAGLSQSGGPLSGATIDSEVSRLVVEAGLATPQEIDFCREQQKQSSDPNQRSLADLLIENSFLTATQVRRVKSQVEERDTSQIPGYALICRVATAWPT